MLTLVLIWVDGGWYFLSCKRLISGLQKVIQLLASLGLMLWVEKSVFHVSSSTFSGFWCLWGWWQDWGFRVDNITNCLQEEMYIRWVGIFNINHLSIGIQEQDLRKWSCRVCILVVSCINWLNFAYDVNLIFLFYF